MESSQPLPTDRSQDKNSSDEETDHNESDTDTHKTPIHKSQTSKPADEAKSMAPTHEVVRRVRSQASEEDSTEV